MDEPRGWHDESFKLPLLRTPVFSWHYLLSWNSNLVDPTATAYLSRNALPSIPLTTTVQKTGGIFITWSAFMKR